MLSSMNADPLEPSTAFPFLVRIVSYNNSYWESMYQNLWKARRQWGVVGKVVTNMGATVWVCGVFYKSIVQSVLLYDIEI